MGMTFNYYYSSSKFFCHYFNLELGTKTSKQTNGVWLSKH